MASSCLKGTLLHSLGLAPGGLPRATARGLCLLGREGAES